MLSHFGCVRLFVTPWTTPTRLFCPWDSSGKDTGVGWHALLQGIFPTQGSNLHLLCLLHWQVDSLPPDSAPTHKQAAFHTLMFLLSFHDLTFDCVLCLFADALLHPDPSCWLSPYIPALKCPLRLPWLPFSWFLLFLASRWLLSLHLVFFLTCSFSWVF